MGFYGCLSGFWVSTGIYESMDVYGYLRVSMNICGVLWDCMGIYGFFWVSKFLWLFIGLYGCL